MGLIKAAAGAIGGTLADQWKDYFYCDAIDADTLVVKGSKRGSDRSSNTKGESNVISDGAGIAVADGQCMMIVEQGKVIELCAEPGIFTYNSGMSPSIFSGDLKENLKGAAKDAWERFQFGGGVGRDQRIYYFNTKELPGNKYGTPAGVPFLVVDKNVTMGDLKGTLEMFAKKMFGEETKIRLRPSYFPFTEPSAEMDISCNICGGKGCPFCKGTGWVEILGCGMVDPNVLELNGIDSKVYSGYALGMGIERITNLKYQVKDLRMFSENDVRFLKEFEAAN